jgi:hypothetical protein
VDATTQIKEGSEVRIRVVGVRADPQDMVSREVVLCMARVPAVHARCRVAAAGSHLLHVSRRRWRL